LTLDTARFRGLTIAELGAATGLEELRLRECDAGDVEAAVDERALDFLPRLRALTRLEIAGDVACVVLSDAHLAAIGRHAPLRRLALNDSPHFTAAGVAALSQLTALTSFELRRFIEDALLDFDRTAWPPCAGVAALAAALPLRELRLEAPPCADLSFLSLLTSLTKLELQGATRGAQAALAALAGSLESLALLDLFLVHAALPAVLPLTRLTSLAFSQAPICSGEVTDEQLAGLRGLPRLRVLSIALLTEHAALSSEGIDALLALPSLRRLSLQMEEVGNLTAACVERIKAHPATLFFQKIGEDDDGSLFQRIAGEPPLVVD